MLIKIKDFLICMGSQMELSIVSKLCAVVNFQTPEAHTLLISVMALTELGYLK